MMYISFPASRQGECVSLMVHVQRADGMIAHDIRVQWSYPPSSDHNLIETMS